MNLRLFQIVTISIAAIFLIRVIYRLFIGRTDVYANLIYGIIWSVIFLLALFPDQIASRVANLFGIKNNINAILFLFLGLIIFLQLKMFNHMRRQEKSISTLFRKLAILEHDQEKNEDSLRS